MKFKFRYLLWGIMPVLLIYGAFALQQKSPELNGDPLAETLPSRRQLRRNFFEKREVVVVYESKNQALIRRYERLPETFANAPTSGFRGNVKVKFKRASSLTEAELGNSILFLTGTPESNPLLKRLLRDNPLDITEDGIAFGNKKITNKEAVLLISMYPNPVNTNLPMGLISGIDEENVLAFFETMAEQEGQGIFRQNLDFNIFQDDARIVLGNFDQSWKIDTKVLFDFSDNSTEEYSSEYFDFISHAMSISADSIKAIANKADKTAKIILNFLEHSESIPRIEYHIYSSSEHKGLISGNTDQAHYTKQDKAVHTIINNNYLENYIEKENDLIINSLIGVSELIAFNKGLPVYFTDQWQKKGYKYWTARLFDSGNALSLEELLNNEIIAIESPLMVACLSASLVDFLLQTWGKIKFLNAYDNWVPTRDELRNLSSLWNDYLVQLAAKHRNKFAANLPLPYIKGFNFAHEGYSIYNGYASAMASAAIEKQHNMGSNAIALVPYSYIQNVNKPAAFNISNYPGTENDQAIVHSAYKAKQLGMFSLLKPQIYVGNSWPGDIEMLNDADWDKFFDYYYRWIRHYAFLAEIHHLDALSVGVEFTKATLGHGDRWRKMISNIRGLYGGKITYAANWGAEFENIDFWDAVDFIGLNCYYPLSKKDNPTDAEMRMKFDTVKTKIKTVYSKYNKAVVFTEIGFRSINMPWKNPHAEGDDSFNDEHQRRCYEVVLEGIKGEEWCAGILWWKFPSYLDYRGTENSAFTPNNKTAEATVRKWFSQELGR